MERGQRIALIVATLVVLIVAFVVLRPSDEDEGDSPASAQPAGTTDATAPRTPAAPPTPRVAVRDGEPVGGEAKIDAKKGDTVRFTVTSDAPHEVHLHGYDISRDAGPGKPARFSFPAKDDGIFEVELEDVGTEIARLKVEP
ncbi:MAG: hypothetical protein H0T15_07445 [Thermoleophilaceae bacterium]|nr:hypothetical protein [Thermoleophilaceae bacterium]